MATPLTAAVRWAVIGPPSSTATGKPVTGSLSRTSALIVPSPRALLVGKPTTHFMPTRSASPEASGPGR